MTLPRVGFDPVMLQILDMINLQKVARKLPRTDAPVK
jgi:hypothetical protein